MKKNTKKPCANSGLRYCPPRALCETEADGGEKQFKKDFDSCLEIGKLIEVASSQHRRKKRNKVFDSRRSVGNIAAN